MDILIFSIAKLKPPFPPQVTDYGKSRIYLFQQREPGKHMAKRFNAVTEWVFEWDLNALQD